MSKSYKRILLVRLDKIGDVLLSTPAIKAVRDAYPESFIAFMVQPYAYDVVGGNPCLDKVISYDKNGTERTLFGNIKFIAAIRKLKFDLALILHPTTRTHIVTFLSGIPERVGYDRKTGWLLTKRIRHTKEEGAKHEVDYTLDIVRSVGIEPKDMKLYMPIKERSERRIEYIFSQEGLKGHKTVIVMHPAASCPSKRWPLANFAKIGDALAKRYKAGVVIITGAEDKSFGDKVASMMREKAVNLSGVTTVADVASVLKRSMLLISNDSGPVHIASAVGTPAIAIFGRKDRGLSPLRWGPTGKEDVAFHKDAGCDICLAHNCKKGFKCLEAVTVDEVIAAAEKILGNIVLTP
jgi:lipopolysaccharide heptosyltransferase II